VKHLWVRAALASLLLSGSVAHAESSGGASWLPGEARQITRSSSASRDTAAFDAIVYPRFAVTLGSEFGLLAWSTPQVTWRVGALALFGLESRTKSQRLFPAPGGDSNLWRGILGYELACSFDALARGLGEHGAIEAAAGYYHESEHHTASNDPVTPTSSPDGADLRARPQIGNYLAIDWATRLPAGRFEFVLRDQAKWFVNGALSERSPFRAGTGAELVVQVHGLSPALLPFSATYAEALFAPRRSSAHFFRSLLGCAFPGKSGEFRLFASLSSGAGEGLLIPERQTALGGGLRFTPFTPEWR